MDTQNANSLSNHAIILLKYLVGLGGRWCIGQLHGTYQVIPSPTFNWDGRYEARVLQPESIPELVQQGFLIVEVHTACNCDSDHSSVSSGHKNRVHVLTDAGREYSARLTGKQKP